MIWLNNQCSGVELRSCHAAVFVSDSPANIKLNVGIKQGNNWGSGSPPPTHSGPDQTLLLGMPHHLNESGTLAVSLRHKVLQLLLQLIYKTHTHTQLSESKGCLRANLRPQDAVMPSSSGHCFIARRPKVLMFHHFDHWTKMQQLEPALQTSTKSTSHNGMLQYWDLSLQWFSKRWKEDKSIHFIIGFQVYLQYHCYTSFILYGES